MNTPKVADVRLTLIWVETNLALVNDPQPKGAPLADLGRDTLYALRFETIRGAAAPGAAGPLTLPWPDGSEKQRFWRSYLSVGRGNLLNAVPGSQAWKGLVPLRTRLPCAIDVPHVDEARVVAEGFYYPHGFALAVTIHAIWTTPPALYDAVDVLHGIVTGATSITVDWPGQASQSIPVDAFATDGLAWLRNAALGPKAAGGIAVDRPYSVLTFVGLQDVDAAAPAKDQDDVHRALEAVTQWLPDWRINSLPPLADRRAIIRSAPPSHICYVTGAGLAVWFPAPALAADRRRTLGCYHRNQVFAALQIESIDEMLTMLDEIATKGGTRSPTADQCAKLGAGIVGRLYGGADDTYRSGSARCHIDRRKFVAAVNRMRACYNMPALHSDQVLPHGP